MLRGTEHSVTHLNHEASKNEPIKPNRLYLVARVCIQVSLIMRRRRERERERVGLRVGEGIRIGKVRIALYSRERNLLLFLINQSNPEVHFLS